MHTTFLQTQLQYNKVHRAVVSMATLTVLRIFNRNIYSLSFQRNVFNITHDKNVIEKLTMDIKYCIVYIVENKSDLTIDIFVYCIKCDLVYSPLNNNN